MSGSETNCGRSSVDKSEESGWFNTLLRIASKNEHYCALGEGGFWKRGTYAASRAFAAHRYDSASFLNAPELFGLGVAPSVPTSYYSCPGYAGDRFAARYASAVGRDALRNMFREFWPDISSHMLHRHP
jgi:hypothetical protein